MDFYNKFNMSVDENIFVAKRNIIDYVYKSARLEGLGVTFPDTEAVINGGIVQNLRTDDVIAINNLKHAWQFIIANIDYPMEYPLVCEINRRVGGNLFFNAGFPRNIPVSIGGTSWQPPIPIESDIRDEMLRVKGFANATECAIVLMLMLMRRQIFLDGNKRTAMLAANHIMISNGAGIISVPVEHIAEFTKKLVNYYETDDMQDVKEFIFDTSIDGLDMQAARFVRESSTPYDVWKANIDAERNKK